MTLKCISLFCFQVLRALGLIRGVKPHLLSEGSPARWGLLVRGRGFERLLEDEILIAPNLIRPDGWNLPRPREYCSRLSAEHAARNLGLPLATE